MLTGAEADKVLTTDASGVASWQTPAGGATPGGSTGYVQFNNSGAFGADSNLFWDNINERLGIGTTGPQTKLDVAGAIKIGSQDTCNSNTEGAIRYNSASKKFEGCNGTSWQQIEKLFSCGDSVAFIYKGSRVTYGTVEVGDSCWMDRNLGAFRVATAYNDSAAYGDLFQWGRLDDGHQTRTSVTTTTLSSTDVPGHGNFILAPNSPYDWRSPQNNSLWQGVSGTNNPCPSGWRLPTLTECEDMQSVLQACSQYSVVFEVLKLPNAGRRSRIDGSFYQSSNFWYWTSSTRESSGVYTAAICGFTTSPGCVGGWYNLAWGFPIRCIKD